MKLTIIKSREEISKLDYYQARLIVALHDYQSNIKLIEEDMLNTLKIIDLDVSIRLVNSLKYSGIETLGQIMSMNETEIKNIEHLGKKSIIELVKILKEIGLYRPYFSKYL